MSDNISRADAIEAVCKLQKYDLDERNRLRIYAPWHGAKRIFVETEAIYKTIHTLPSAEAEPKWDCTANFVAEQLNRLRNMTDEERWGFLIRFFSPSTEADGEDLIIKGAKGIQDGLYNIKDGKLFKYMAKGGTVRTYPIVTIDCAPTPFTIKTTSADAAQGEWEFVDNEIFAGEYFCSICGKRAEVDLYGEWILSNFCPSCGARMLREDGEA